MLKSLDLTPFDREWLGRILARPAEISPRQSYAQALAQEGEVLRAEIVKLTCSALLLENIGTLDDLLEQLPAHHIGWSRLIGATLIVAMAKRNLSKYVPRWMPFVLPALTADENPTKKAPPIGSTFFWGNPDLPEGFKWPEYSDCQRFFEELPESYSTRKCHFVGQFNLAELGLTMFGSCGLTEGLLSVFAYDEYDEYGISEVAMFLFPDLRSLRRVKHPNLDEYNSRRPCHRISFEYCLTIPDDAGPWAKKMALAKKDGNKFSSVHEDIIWDCGISRFGLFGHVHSTGQRDPTPDTDWQRLVSLPGDEERFVWHHIAIRREDLQAGNIENCRLVLTTMDD